MTIKHSEIRGSVHVPYNFEYANPAERNAASGMLPGDAGKLARQMSDNSLWLVASISDGVPAWVSVGGSSAAGIAYVADNLPDVGEGFPIWSNSVPSTMQIAFDRLAYTLYRHLGDVSILEVPVVPEEPIV